MEKQRNWMYVLETKFQIFEKGMKRRNSCNDLKEEFDANGYVIISSCIPTDILQLLQEECDAVYKQVQDKGGNLFDLGCVLDFLASAEVDEGHPSRTNETEYLKLREKFSPCNSAAVIGEWMLHGDLTLQVSKILGEDQLKLFNEQYIVKPANSEARFAWHTDEAEQLMMLKGIIGNNNNNNNNNDNNAGNSNDPVHQQEEYVSAWCPLDKVHADNGTLVVLPRTHEQPANEEEFENENWWNERGVVIPDLNAGDVVLFSSNLWHCSGPNNTDVPRRVFYTQYSKGSILVPTATLPHLPLAYAVPCSLTTKMQRI